MTLDEIYKKNSTIEGRILKFRADRAPLALSLLVFIAQLAAWYWLPLAGAIVAGVLLLPFLGSCAIFNHHQQHHNVFNHRALNRAWEVILGTQTMITSYAWVLHHNFGHHPHYLTQPPCPRDEEDESRWARRDGSQMGRIEYTLNLMFRAPIDSILVGLRRRPRELLWFTLMLIPYLALQLALAWVNWQNYLAVFFGAVIPNADLCVLADL
jgi:hypothetical protein